MTCKLGGEERQALVAAGIPSELVPGITAAAGCAARLGVPLTHREHAHSVVLATGHPRKGAAMVLPAISRKQTLVVYMGLSRLRELCGELLQQGLAPDTPAALVQEGTTPHERSLLGTLATLPAQAAAHGFRAPALLIVGDVVRLGAEPGAGGEGAAEATGVRRSALSLAAAPA